MTTTEPRSPLAPFGYGYSLDGELYSAARFGTREEALLAGRRAFVDQHGGPERGAALWTCEAKPLAPQLERILREELTDVRAAVERAEERAVDVVPWLEDESPYTLTSDRLEALELVVHHTIGEWIRTALPVRALYEAAAVERHELIGGGGR